ncbi:MAG: ABC transporter substrate-binding protein [Desulfobacterium sp.]|nr:ABC transporter substrate-binding protein [Desulfobacterium sp.]
MNPKNLITPGIIGLVLGVTLFWSNTVLSACSSTPMAQKDVVIIGERTVATALRLNILPAAWVGRKTLWEGAGAAKAGAQFLSCPNGFAGPKKTKVKKALEQYKGMPVLLSKAATTCLYKPEITPAVLEKQLNAWDITPVVIDFTKGIDQAVKTLGDYFNCQEKATAELAAYHKQMDRAQTLAAKVRPGIKVAVISGTFQAATGKSFLRLEAPGGYTDTYILKMLKARNLAHAVITPRDKISKGHLTIREIDKILAATPDVIVITGDSLAVQVAISRAVAKNPALSNTPALKNQAVFSLPFYSDADPLSYPQVLMEWVTALGGQA